MNATNENGATNPVHEATANSINESAEVIMQANHEEVKDQNEHGANSVGDDEPWALTESMSEEFQASEVNTERAVLRLAEKASAADAEADKARNEPDLIKRASALHGLGAFKMPDFKWVNVNDGMKDKVFLSTDINRWAFFDSLFDKDVPARPHYDTFKGKCVDHKGDEIGLKYKVRRVMLAMQAANLKLQSADEVRKSLRNWALEEEDNSLIRRMNELTPKWDGVPRLDTFLIDLHKPHDTQLNREFGRYFWLSLYCRVMTPGCYAPMVLSLFGGQNAGKSHMSRLICQEITGDKDSDSALLDLELPVNNFLRKITGKSVIANIGEMAGFTRSKLANANDFITRTTDLMDFKYDNETQHARQWIITMDSNRYQGLQRDDTGNRRFYPVFCGQLDDANGQPQWDENFKINYTNFSEKFWQVMAECREWLERNGGMEGYKEFVDGVVQKVKDFNENERKNDRGTVHDPELEGFFTEALIGCEMRFLKKRDSTGRKGVNVWQSELISSIKKLFSTSRGPNKSHIMTKVSKEGGEAGVENGKPVFFFECESGDAFLKRLKGNSDFEHDPDGIVVNKKDENGGF